MSSSTRTPVLIDVDTGIDDSLALLYLLASPDADILGISCTAGNVPAQQVAINNLAWLELCGRSGIEVSLGAEVPLLAPLMTTEETHGPQGIGYAQLPKPRQAVSARHAVQLWIDTVRARPGEVVGLVTGPLTNLALAVKLEPELPELLKRLVVMGGAFNHPGNTTPSSEWNVAVDPEAAKLVFDAFGVLPEHRQPIVCPLDVTETVIMLPRHLAALAAAAGSDPVETPGPEEPLGSRSQTSNPVVRHLIDAVRFYFEFHASQGQGYLSHMHDPFAAALALDPGLAQLRHATVDVELGGTLCRGATVADWHGLWRRPKNAWVAVQTEPEAFFDDLIRRVAALARSVPA